MPERASSHKFYGAALALTVFSGCSGAPLPNFPEKGAVISPDQRRIPQPERLKDDTEAKCLGAIKKVADELKAATEAINTTNGNDQNCIDAITHLATAGEINITTCQPETISIINTGMEKTINIMEEKNCLPPKTKKFRPKYD